MHSYSCSCSYSHSQRQPQHGVARLLLALLVLSAAAVTTSSFACAWRTTTTTASISRTSCYHNHHHHHRRPSSSTRLYQSSHGTPSSAAQALLNAEQDKVVAAKGAREGELMVATQSPLLAPPPPKGAGSKGGFGGGGAKIKVGKKPPAAVVKALTKVLRDDGVVRIDNVISKATVAKLRAYIMELRAESEAAVAAGTVRPLERFADVLLRHNRCDLTIPLGDATKNDPDSGGAAIVHQALYEALCASAVGGVVSKTLGGGDAVLYELSALISDPGSQRQVIHPDTPWMEHGQPILLTCFIALQDITAEMGPTTWIPGTHTLEAQLAFNDDEAREDGSECGKDRLLRTTPSVAGTLPAGSCGLYDSRVLHCGGGNASLDETNKRGLFYFTFRNPAVPAVVGNPGSIRRDLIGQWTLDRLQSELEMAAKGKPSSLSWK